MADGSRYVSDAAVERAARVEWEIDLDGAPNSDERWATDRAEYVPAMRAALEAVAGDIAAAVRREEDASVIRFEVIDHTPTTGEGRVLVRYDVAVERSYQDAGRTLKVFLKEREISP